MLTEESKGASYELIETEKIKFLQNCTILTETIFIFDILIKYNDGSIKQKQIQTNKTYYYDEELDFQVDLTYFANDYLESIQNLAYRENDLQNAFLIPLQVYNEYCTQFPLNISTWKNLTQIYSNQIPGKYIILPPQGQCIYEPQNDSITQLYFYESNKIIDKSTDYEIKVEKGKYMFKKIVQNVLIHMSFKTQSIQIIESELKTSLQSKILKIGDNTFILRIERILNESLNYYYSKSQTIQYGLKDYLIEPYNFTQTNKKQTLYFQINDTYEYLNYNYSDSVVAIQINVNELNIKFNETFQTDDCDLTYHKKLQNLCFSYCENDTYFNYNMCQKKICQKYKPYFDETDHTCKVPETPDQWTDIEMYTTVEQMDIICYNGSITYIQGYKTCDCKQGYETTIIQNNTRIMCTQNQVINKTQYPDASIGFIFGEDSILTKFFESLPPVLEYIIIIAIAIGVFLIVVLILFTIVKCCCCCGGKQKKEKQESQVKKTRQEIV